MMKPMASWSCERNRVGKVPGCGSVRLPSSLLRLTRVAPRNSRRPSLNSAVACTICARSTKTASRSRPSRPSAAAVHARLPQLAAELLRAVGEVRIGIAGRVLADAVADAIAALALLGGVAEELLAGLIDLLHQARSRLDDGRPP